MTILRNINYIAEMNRIPCAPGSPWIIIKTAFEAGPPALLSLFLPGCTDILKTKIGVSPWHARGISSAIKSITQPEALGGKKFLYKVGYFTAEKYLWWWLVADVTTEFFTTWQSLVFQEQQCELPGNGTAYGYFAPFVYGRDQKGYLEPAPLKLVPGVSVGVNIIRVDYTLEASAGYQVEWDSYPVRGQGGNVSTWWEEVDNPIINDFATTNNPIQKNRNTTGGSWFQNEPHASGFKQYRIGFEVQSDTLMQVVSSHWTIGTQGKARGNSVWGCKPKPVVWPFP